MAVSAPYSITKKAYEVDALNRYDFLMEVSRGIIGFFGLLDRSYVAFPLKIFQVCRLCPTDELRFS